jgi:hypothetical protein
MKKWDFEMYSWKLDFTSMCGMWDVAEYGGDVTYERKLYTHDGHLCYKDNHVYKLVANTTDDRFNKAITKAWTDFCFERDILNHKMEKS